MSDIIQLASREIGEGLRFFLSGAAGVSIAVLGIPQAQAYLLYATGSAPVWAFLATSVTSGCVVYSLHRAVLHPLLAKFSDVAAHQYGQANQNPFLEPLFPPDRTRAEMDFARWQARGDAERENVRSLAVWAAQIHFLYTASLIPVVLWWLLPLVGVDVSYPAGVWSLIVVMFSAALLSDARQTWYEHRWHARLRGGRASDDPAPRGAPQHGGETGVISARDGPPATPSDPPPTLSPDGRTTPIPPASITKSNRRGRRAQRR